LDLDTNNLLSKYIRLFVLTFATLYHSQNLLSIVEGNNSSKNGLG